MKNRPSPPIASRLRAATPPLLLLALGACAGPSRPPGSEGAALPGPVRSPVGLSAIDRADPPPAEPTPMRLPDRITLPAAYRLMLLDGHLSLVRETDEETLRPGAASLRVVTGEIARGEIAYQPALLPQELAAELAANREGAARMNDALDGVLRRSRELSEQARELAEQNRRLEDLLRAAEARVRELESQKNPPVTNH
jgi:hypothetical protein